MDSYAGPNRTVDQVESSAKAAGLTNTRGPVQLLHFGPQLNSDDIKLLELPHEVLTAVSGGQKVVIRGDPSEDAVLCTAEKTYELREADTSNALLICPTLSLPKNQCFQDLDVSLVSKEVTACLSSYMELRPCRPRTEKLKQLLAECPYRGAEFEASEEFEEVANERSREGGEREVEGARCKRKRMRKKYTFDELLAHVQASESELCEALDRLQACMIDGYWRLFDLDYRDSVFQHILTVLEEEDWSFRVVPLEATCQKLEELEPRFAIEHCLKCYGNVFTSDTGTTYCELSEEKVCQFYAELLLRPAGKFNYHEFMESWRQSVPEGMRTNLVQLKGLALADMNCMPPVIWHFPVSNLPQETTARFNKLFSVREKWTHDEIEPYIRDLEMPTQSLNALLLKHVRVSTNARGQKMYNAKRTAH